VSNRELLRATFDVAAETYHAARPRYPAQLFDDLAALAGLAPGSRVLEVGPGTGIATLELARRGYVVDAIELGESLAAVARRTLEPHANASVRVGAFEQAEIEAGAYDLVTSATAWHWIDKDVGYVKAARALKPGGAFAPFSNTHTYSAAAGDFFEEVQQLYNRLTPEIAGEYEPLRRVEELPQRTREEIEASGLFGPVAVRHYSWDEPYTAASYIAVLNTYSGHLNLPDEKRRRLLDAIANLIDTRYGGRIVKGYGAILYVARRQHTE
jgi:SAM-dependent methyltransferase